MTLDQILMAFETLLLIRILWQGEYVMHYEREVYKLHAARDKERRDWREAKRRMTTKKMESGPTGANGS